MKNAKKIYLTVLTIVTALVVIIGWTRACTRVDDKIEAKFDDEDAVVSESYDKSFSDLIVDAGVASITIQSGSAYSVTQSYADDRYALLFKANGDKLKITQRSSHAGDAIGAKNVNVDLVITVPAGTELDKMDIDLGIGKLTIDGVVADKGDFDIGVGDVEIRGIGDPHDYDLDVDLGIGNIELGEREKGGLGTEISWEGTNGHKLDFDIGTGDLTFVE